VRQLLAVVALGCATAPHAAAPPSPVAAPVTFDSVVAYLRSEVDSAFPGAVVAVGHNGKLALLAAVGHYGSDDRRPVDTATVYDLASLTKVIGLTTVCMMLVNDGKLDLDAPVQRYVPAFRGANKERVTVRHLLTHSSGLPAWRPLFVEATTRAAALAIVDTTPLAAAPGATMVYSDLGAMLLMQVVEAITGQRLDALLESRVFGPLGLRDTRFLPPADWKDRIAPTERSQDGTIIRGTVHDENAWKLGGVSGHAGLFGTAPDLARFGFWLLDSWHGRLPGAPVLPSELVKTWTRRQELPAGSSRALGWDTPSGTNSSAGTKLGPLAFGHTGFTGTSIWFDPEQDLFIILLTNRVNPSRENGRIARVRPRVADLAVAALTAAR
jgi:CubicO group peptidase (beta-lactamase class C family)